MTKFKGNGIVWNPETDKPLCSFKKGSLETDDHELIVKLQGLGYKQIVEEESELLNSNEETPKEETKVPNKTQSNEDSNSISEDFKELRQLAKEKNIPGYMNKTKIKLQKLIYPKKNDSEEQSDSENKDSDQ